MNRMFQRLVNFSLAQVLLFGFVLSLVYYFVAFDSGSSYQIQIVTLEADIVKEEAHKKETDAALKEEARMKDAVGLLSQQYQEISRRLPTALSSIDLNRQIDAFARNSGASIKSRRPMNNLKQEIVEEVPIQITLEGSYSELAQFVYNVAQSEKVTAVRSFTIGPLDRSNQLRLDGVIVGYQLSADAPKDAVGKPAGARQ